MDGAFVDDFAGTAVALEGSAARHEGGVTHLVGGGDDAANVDLGARGEVDAGGVDQVNLTVGRELAVDLAGVGTIDAVKRHGAAGRLDELDFSLAADIKGVPVNRCTVTGLGDGHGVATGANGGNTGGDLTTGR